MLTRLWARDVEPFDKPLELDLGSRLNLLCGDNGLGKTFVLDLAWYVLTDTWAQKPVLPKYGESAKPTFGCHLVGAGEDHDQSHTFDFEHQEWLQAGGVRVPLVLYAKANGDCAIWDHYRTVGVAPDRLTLARMPNVFSFRAAEIWDGLYASDGAVFCNGLLRDWVSWQYQQPETFGIFSKVLATLSPPGVGESMAPGPSRRVSVEDVRDIPTLKLPYGDVPVTHASAGMRRVLALAYMLVWTWHEHRAAARLRNAKPLGELILLIDEVDAHLHPQWQRVVLPALFQAVSAIEPSLRVQLIASTHAPLVLASVETIFDESTDKLLHFALDEGGKIKVEELPWVKQGDATNWLVSESFGLQQARSRKAEVAIESAEAFMRGEPVPPFDTREAIEAELRRVLPDHDDFWPRWIVETGPVR
jgi:hypothetical protein